MARYIQASCNIRVKCADLFAKTNSQDLYTMIDELKEEMDGLVRKHKVKSKLHRDDTVKHATEAA